MTLVILDWKLTLLQYDVHLTNYIQINLLSEVLGYFNVYIYLDISRYISKCIYTPLRLVGFRFPDSGSETLAYSEGLSPKALEHQEFPCM